MRTLVLTQEMAKDGWVQRGTALLWRCPLCCTETAESDDLPNTCCREVQAKMMDPFEALMTR